MIAPTKTFIAALICAPLTMLIPAQRADACSPPAPGIMFDGAPALPTMPASQAAIPIKFHYYNSSPGIENFSVQVFNNKGVETAGSLSIVQLIQTPHGTQPGAFPQHNALLVWRPDADMDGGEHLVHVKSIPSPDAPGQEQTLDLSIDISPNAPVSQLGEPTLTAALKATPVGADQTCCPIPELSKGLNNGACIPEAGYAVAEPLGAGVRCGDMQGDACELCWPQRYDAAPTLDASWAPAVDGLPAELTYYEVTLSSASAEKTGTFYGADAFVHSFGADNMDASYCVSITAFGFDGQTATVERCFDRADLPALPADVGVVTGTDRRTECIPPDEPDMGTADMDAPDMSEPDMDAPDMSGADMAADMDAPDMSEPGPKTTTSGDGGCATPGGTSPIAPALLAALGLVGWLRRRRS
jgi:hypothetical protein